LATTAANPSTPQTLEMQVWHRDGHWCDTETTITSLLHDPRIRGLVLNTRDVSERRRLQDALTRQAFSDALTGLANRALFRDSVEGALTASDTGHVAVVFMDLNGFKAVNDSQGHAVGDHLLTLVGQRLRNCVRPGDVVARLGGDEFAVLVTGEKAEAGAVWVADRVRRVLAGDFVLDNRSVTLGAAIGIAVNDDGTETADQLLRNADLAMYRAKAAQRTEFLRFEASMHDDLVARVDAEKDLRRAVERGDLRLHYQPLVDLRTGDVVGCEALARWNHPERGLIPPSQFIDLAEETGLVEQIGAWALHQAAADAAAWQHFAPEGLPFRVSVNVSGRQVGAGLPRTVRDALAVSGLPAGALTLEMTESVLMERPDEAAAILARLKTLGVRIAVDDFGTGYSSLSYLSRFPVDVLKIDRSFVEHVDRDSEPSELVRTMVQLGQGLNLVTVAEGIETVGQRDAVAAMGCTYGQGYLFSKALPADAMAAFLRRAVLAHA
jgi:diguanylate cyclase (GGDEF)-like protein